MSRTRLLRRAAAASATATTTVALVLSGGSAVSAAPARHALYTLTNADAASGGNAVLAFRATSAGLAPIGTYQTGGDGNGGGLGSQGAVVLGDGDRHLAAVNAGSSSLSVFAVDDDGALRLLDVTDTGGATPVSATISDRHVYVLNAGSATIAGFDILGDHLRPIEGSTRSLSPGAAGAAQISFTPDGRHLVVTEKASNTIDTFTVDRHGVAGAAVSQPSSGATPFGFGFARNGVAVVSDAAGGALGAAAVSSYAVTDGGVVNRSVVADTQTAACWIAVTSDGRFAFTTNAGSGTVSTYRVADDGTLALVAPVAATITGHPSDEAVGAGTLFVLENNGHRIAAAAVGATGALGAPADVVTGLPASAAGIAATAG